MKKTIYHSDPHTCFNDSYYQGMYVGWTVTHFFYCPMRRLYGVVLEKIG